jgi:hypothetical protein
MSAFGGKAVVNMQPTSTDSKRLILNVRFHQERTFNKAEKP